jgi:AAA domain (Cdc48 subfamily)
MTEITGWKSRVDIALQTRRRIILYGNTEDLILEGEQTATLIEWLRRRLAGFEGLGGCTRIVYYNHAEEPRVLMWQGADAGTEQDQLNALMPASGRSMGGPRSSDPSIALRTLGRLLESENAAVIIENAQHRYDEPSLEAVLLRQLLRESYDGNRTHGRIVHIYNHESRIPPDFVRSDPDTTIILVSLPSYEERLALFKGLPSTAPIRGTTELGVRITSERLARLTEGFRLSELHQIAALAANAAERRDVGIDIAALLSRFRHGRRVDYWVRQQIDDIREKLHGEVRGQSDAIDQVIQTLYKAKHRIGPLIDELGSTPAMVLFFVGATGVGKTLMARAICRALIGNEESLKRLDMTEYQQEHTDQRLIGPPPGYVGHLEGGQLTNWVLEHPYSVVLIDEVEKAHPRILDKFMQILEGARLTDGKGQTVDMTETILIFTSNIGSAEADEENLERNNRAAVEAYFHRQVERYFDEDLERPEIFNRLKRGVVVFDYITEDIARNVIQKRLEEMASGVERRLGGDIKLRFDVARADDQRVVDVLLGRTNFTKYGLRDVNNILYEDVGGPLARWLDSGPTSRPGGWRYYWNDAQKKIDVRPG